jgi:transcriptional regulator with XRE-family HTH domain
MTQTFGEKMRQLRLNAGLTQEALARAADLGLGVVRDWEQDRRKPSLANLFKLCEALEVSCEVFHDCDLADRAEQPEPPAKKGRKRKAD